MSRLFLLLILPLFSLSSIADDTRKAGNAEIQPFMDSFGYIAREPAASEEERGEQVYVQWCAICHRDGPGMAGTQVLKMRYKGTLPAVLEERKNLTPSLIKLYVREGMGSMPYFRKTEISDSDLQALSLYLTDKGTGSTK